MNLNKNLLIGALLTGLTVAPAIAADRTPLRHGDWNHGRYDTQQQKHRDGRHEQRRDRARHENRQRHDTDYRGRDHGQHHADANRNRHPVPHHRKPGYKKHHAYPGHHGRHHYRKHSGHDGRYHKPYRKHHARHHDQRYDGRIGKHYYRSQPWRIQVFDRSHRLRSSIPIARGAHWEVRGNRIIVKNRGHVRVYAGPRYHLVKSYRVHDRHNRDTGLRFGFRF